MRGLNQGFVLAMFIVLNANHGPDETDFHYRRVKDICSEHFDVCSPRTSPMFQTLVGRIAAERGDAIDVAEGQTLEDAVWTFCKESNRCRPKGYKSTMAGYCAAVHDLRDLLPTWSQRLFENSVAAIELNMLTSKSLPVVKLAADPVAADPAAASEIDVTNPRKLTIADRTIRSCGGNAVVLSLALLSEDTHKLLVEIIVAVTTPTMLFSAESCRELKDVKRSQCWLVQMNQGRVYDHVLHTFDALRDEDLMVRLGFASSKPTASVASPGHRSYFIGKRHRKK